MTSLRERWTLILVYVSRVVTAMLGIGLVLALFSSMPRKSITLEAGTEGGLFDVMARQVADDLEPHGIKVTIVNRPDSLKIIDDIVDPKSPVEAGFVASDASASHYDKVSQVGTVMIAPIYLLTHVESDVRNIADFANRSISLYPVGSAAWAACDYILESYGVDIVDANSQYGNGQTVVNNIVDRVTDVGCFVDVPSGASSDYADKILAELANPNLRLIPIPQAQALQARRDFLRPLTIPSGAFNVYPPRPSTDVPTTGVSITFVAKNSLPRELVVMIAHALSQDYRGSTVANQAGELPAINYMNLPVFHNARDVHSSGLPWMYQRFSFGTAAFMDKFINQYGIVLTVLFLFLSTVSIFGLPLPYHWIVGSRPRRTRMILESIDQRARQTGKISRRDQRRLAMIEKWIEKQSFGIDGLEAQLRRIRGGSERTQTN